MSRSEAEGGENKLCTTTLGLFVGGSDGKSDKPLQEEY